MTAILTQSQSVVTSAVSNDEFYGIFLAQPSWAPIKLTRSGWVTAKSNSGKKVPLTRQNIVRAYSEKAIAQIIGKRFSRLTNYFMLDIDIGSIYHPFNGDLLEQILAAMEDLGLCRYLILRSSDSGGLHIYFPLPSPVSSYAIASAVHSHLSKIGITIKAGQCELFPNKKAFNSDYNGHRLPLQKGSFILDSNMSPISDSKQDFVYQWNACADRQDIEALESIFGMPSQSSKEKTLKFTKKGQSNTLMLSIGIRGVREGITNVVKLAKYIETTIKGLEGFAEYASIDTKSVLPAWSQRVAKWALKEQRIKRALNAKHYHKAVSDEAVRRINRAIVFLLESIPCLKGISFTKVGKALIQAGKELFGVGFSWRTLYKNKSLIVNAISMRLATELLLEEEHRGNARSNTPSIRTNEIGNPLPGKGYNPLPIPDKSPKWRAA